MDGESIYRRLGEESGLNRELLCEANDFCGNLPMQCLWDLFVGDGKTGKIPYFRGGFYPFEFFSSVGDLLKKNNVSAERGFLYLYLGFAQRAYDVFMQNKLEENVFFDTFKRIAESAEEFFADKAFYGLYEYHFVACHVRGSIVRLGTLEYCYGTYKNKKAVFMHVPKNADISAEKRKMSYEKAFKYFGKYPIILDSWLIYPENKNILCENSKILDFAKDFEIVSSEESFDYNELFHVFGRGVGEISPDNKALPQKTYLQRKMTERMRQNKPCGSAIGILKETMGYV